MLNIKTLVILGIVIVAALLITGTWTPGEFQTIYPTYTGIRGDTLEATFTLTNELAYTVSPDTDPSNGEYTYLYEGTIVYDEAGNIVDDSGLTDITATVSMPTGGTREVTATYTIQETDPLGKYYMAAVLLLQNTDFDRTTGTWTPEPATTTVDIEGVWFEIIALPPPPPGTITASVLDSIRAEIWQYILDNVVQP